VAKKKTKKSPKKLEEYRVSGKNLVGKVKKLIRDGNVRRITIKNKKGKTVFILPLTLGVAGAILLPPLAAIAAIAALLTECTVSVERFDK